MGITVWSLLPEGSSWKSMFWVCCIFYNIQGFCYATEAIELFQGGKGVAYQSNLVQVTESPTSVVDLCSSSTFI